VLRNKAGLYQVSNPHHRRFDPKAPKRSYRVAIGTWESARFIEVKATSTDQAIAEGKNFCSPDMDVMEVWENDREVWNAYSSY
jgi:hypothetical protein